MSETGRDKGLWVTVAVILALGFIISAAVFGNSLVKARDMGNVVTVTGSAKKQIKSDLAYWTGSFSAEAPEMTTAYNRLKESQTKVKNYLHQKGFADKEIVFSSINTYPRYESLPNGQMGSRVESYQLSQQVEIRSREVDKITTLSREATDLINQGVNFQSAPPQYYYTKLADLKIEMLSAATQDAMKRAERIAQNTDSKVGALRTAHMGVFQITSPYSNDISDYGINDTRSLEKEITAVMNCEFRIK